MSSASPVNFVLPPDPIFVQWWCPRVGTRAVIERIIMIVYPYGNVNASAAPIGNEECETPTVLTVSAERIYVCKSRSV